MLTRFHAVCSFLPLLGFGGPDQPADGKAQTSGGDNPGAGGPSNGSGSTDEPRRSMDEGDFQAELITHIDSMYRLGLTLTRNPRDAEDLVQEALTRALSNYTQFRPDTNMRAWLLAIVRNAFINRYRRERKAPSTVDFDGVEAFVADPSPIIEGQNLSVRDVRDLSRIEEQLDDELRRALYELSDEFRETFLLAVVEELSYKDIAAILDVPIGTVMSRLFRARRQMATRLQSFGRKSGWLTEDGENADGGNRDGADEPTTPAAPATEES